MADMTPAEQIEHWRAKTETAEAEGRRDSARAYKAHWNALLREYADPNGNVRLPDGSGRVTKTAEEIAEVGKRLSARAEQRAPEVAEEDDEPSSRGRGGGAREGGRRRKIETPDPLSTGSHHSRVREAARRAGINW